MPNRIIRGIISLAVCFCLPATQSEAANVWAQQEVPSGGIWTIGVDGQGLTPISPIGSDPVWSPNGARIAFVIDGGAGFGAIAVVNSSGGEATIVADTNEYMDQLPSWAPDSRRIAFITADGSLYVVDADGNNLQQLVERNGDTPATSTFAMPVRPAWSPDGTQIAISLVTDRTASIVLIQSDGSGQTALTDLPGDALHPTWSPDGSRIAFVNGTFMGISMPQDIEINPEEEPLLPPPVIPEIDLEDESPPLPPDVESDSGSNATPSEPMIFDAQPVSEEDQQINSEYGGIYVMNADGTNLHRVTDLLPDPNVTPSWSADGTVLAFGMESTSGPEVWRVHLDGSSAEQLSEMAMSVSPSYSPDGTQMVAISIEAGGVLLVTADGIGATNLLGGHVPIRSIGWSPDSQQLVIAVFEGATGTVDQSQGIYVAAADGSGVVRLVENAGDPAPSPDGSLIAFATVGPNGTGIYVIGWDGANPREVVAVRAYPLVPSWSPDGAKIAFLARGENNNLTMSVVNVDGSGLMELATLGQTYPSPPAWSPDGSQLAYAGPGTGGSDLWIVNVNGSGATQLLDEPGQVEGPAFSPDGNRISFAEKDYDIQQSNALYLVNPDGSDLLALTQWSAAQDPGPTNIAVSSINGASWSPDGSHLGFASINGIAIVKSDGSGTEVISIGPEYECQVRDVSWSPDGARLALSRYCEGSETQLQPGGAVPIGEYEDIYVMNIDGSGLTLVGATALVDRSPVWSPDGTRIAFTNEEAGN